MNLKELQNKLNTREDALKEAVSLLVLLIDLATSWIPHWHQSASFKVLVEKTRDFLTRLKALD